MHLLKMCFLHVFEDVVPTLGSNLNRDKIFSELLQIMVFKIFNHKHVKFAFFY